MENISGMDMQKKLVDSINQLIWITEQFTDPEFENTKEINEIINTAKAVIDKFETEFIVV